MTIFFFRRSFAIKSLVTSSHFLTRVTSFCTKAPRNLQKENGSKTTSTHYSSGIQLSPLFSDRTSHFGGYDIELVDDDTWKVSAGLAHAWRGLDDDMKARSSVNAIDDDSTSVEDDNDFDEIDNLRIRGDLFYKLDRDSKEFEEYSFDFHRRKSSKTRDNKKESEKKETSKGKSDLKERKTKEASKRENDVGAKESKKKMNQHQDYASSDKELLKGFVIKSNMESCYGEKKKVRTPTFNQLTAPYHEPFCLDIYISKASVRACIVHRVTSKVVAVAHSISKDMKFDLGSTRNAAACAAVGGILAQRALADDIHDVVYTPRKGERLEGKLQIVLQSIIDNGVNVKVKLKQKKARKVAYPSAF